MPSLRAPFSGIMEDFKKRGHLYFTDFTDWFNLKVLASVLFMFFTSIGPAVTFASLLQIKTDDDIGAVEVMLSTAITGVMWSLLAGQPLVILGVTGPVSILTISIYGMSKSWGINFLPFYAWAQIWAALMHIVLAILNFCDLITLITRFSVEIFGVLIAVIYIYTGISGISGGFGSRDDFEGGVFQLLISLGTAWLGLQLAGARGWVVLNEKSRDLVADYGPTVALILWSAVPYMGTHARDVDIDKLDVPHSFGTSSGRAWLVDLTDLPTWGIFAAILPGFIITVLFFFDHNVSSLMAQAPEFKLKKPSTFHWDFLVMGCCIFVTGILGIPPTNGLIPQAPLHTRSLTVTKSEQVVSSITGESRRVDVVIKVHEQRVSNMGQAVLIGLMCFSPFLDVLRLVPTAALDGLFLFMGLASFADNQFAERIALFFTEPRLRDCQHRFYEEVPFDFITKFTGLQALACAIIFGITLTPAAVVFPVLIGILIPLRLNTLPKVMDKSFVVSVDPYEGDEDGDGAIEGDIDAGVEMGKGDGEDYQQAPTNEPMGAVVPTEHDHTTADGTAV